MTISIQKNLAYYLLRAPVAPTVGMALLAVDPAKAANKFALNHGPQNQQTMPPTLRSRRVHGLPGPCKAVTNGPGSPRRACLCHGSTRPSSTVGSLRLVQALSNRICLWQLILHDEFCQRTRGADRGDHLRICVGTRKLQHLVSLPPLFGAAFIS